MVAGAAARYELGVGELHRSIKHDRRGQSQEMGTATGVLKRFGDSEWVERLGRVGLVAKGISYGIVGVLAVLVALEVGGAATDRPGALRLLSEQWYGVVCSSPWGSASAPTRSGGSRRRCSTVTTRATTSRAGRSAAGPSRRGALLGLSLLAFSFVTGPRGESRDEPEHTARLRAPARAVARARRSGWA